MAFATASTMTTITWSTRCHRRPPPRPGCPARLCGRLGGMPMKTEPNHWPSAPSIHDRRPPENWHSSPAESWRSLLDDADPATEVEPIGFVHNGFHVDEEQRFRPVEEFFSRDHSRFGHDEPFFDDIDTYGGAGDRASRSGAATPRGELRNGYHRPSRNRHHRPDPDGGAGYGRHSSPDS